MESRTPQVGDMWYSIRDREHLLVLEDDAIVGAYKRRGYYKVLTIESGCLDHAWIEFFHGKCKFIS